MTRCADGPIAHFDPPSPRTQGEDDPHSYYIGYEYCRTGNPTRAAFEQAVASAESGKFGAFAINGCPPPRPHPPPHLSPT